MRFSFLGTGNMGFPLAMNLLEAGEDLVIHSSRPECREEFRKKGALIAANVAELADCDVLCTCLPLPEDVEKAVLGEDGLYARMRPGSLHLEFSTIAPETANALKDAAQQRSIGYIQATVSKTPQVAARGDAPLFVGGDPEAIKKLWPVLEKIGKPENLETVDAACAIKLISNLIGMSNIAVMAEALKIGSLAKIDGRRLLALLLNTGAASTQMQVRGPWILDEDFKARFGIDIAAKDLRLGLSMAKELGYEPKMIGQTFAYLNEGHSQGIGDEDVCAIYKLMQ